MAQSNLAYTDHHWMPFTANREFLKTPRIIDRASGMLCWDKDGNELIDASAGLFCVAAGHCRTQIVEAIQRQAAKLDYTAPFQTSNSLSFELARKITELTPTGIDHVFFGCSGSEAVDTAIKFCYAYHLARGDGQRQRLVSRERAYHGVNLGGTSLSGLLRNRKAFGMGLPGVVHMRHTWLEENRYVRGQPQKGGDLAEDLERFTALYGGDNIAACFVEPVAGSTGVLVPPVGYLQRLREICDQHGILLVFDEVICGFGRLGKPFGSQAFNVKPDIMTMAKALTNGAVPMGAVAVSNEIYDTVVKSAPPGIELFHGYTYSGHPLACAAGIASLDLYKEEGLTERAAEMSDYFLDAMFDLESEDAVVDIRGYGLIAGVEVAPSGAPGARGFALQMALFENGMHAKSTGEVVVLAPPLIAERADIDRMAECLRKSLREV